MAAAGASDSSKTLIHSFIFGKLKDSQLAFRAQELDWANSKKNHMPIALYLFDRTATIFISHPSTWRCLETAATTHRISIQFINDPADIRCRIADVAKKGPIDLLIIGAHGYTYTIKLAGRTYSAKDLTADTFQPLSRIARIFLFSCWTGSTKDGFAQQLTDISQLPVFAPKETLFLPATCMKHCTKHDGMEMRSYSGSSREQMIQKFTPLGQKPIDYCDAVVDNDNAWFYEHDKSLIADGTHYHSETLAIEAYCAVQFGRLPIFKDIINFVIANFPIEDLKNFINQILKMVVDEDGLDIFLIIIRKCREDISRPWLNQIIADDRVFRNRIAGLASIIIHRIADVSKEQLNQIINLAIAYCRFVPLENIFNDQIADVSTEQLKWIAHRHFDMLDTIITHRIADVSKEQLNLIIDLIIVNRCFDTLDTIITHRIADVSKKQLNLIIALAITHYNFIALENIFNDQIVAVSKEQLKQTAHCHFAPLENIFNNQIADVSKEQLNQIIVLAITYCRLDMLYTIITHRIADVSREQLNQIIALATANHRPDILEIIKPHQIIDISGKS